MLTKLINQIKGCLSFPNKILVDDKMESNSALRIELKNKEPIELIDLTNSFFSIADEYKRYVEAEHGEINKENVKLYVKDIRHGSIIADLISNSPAALPILSTSQNIEAIVKFASYLKMVYDFLLGKDDKKPNIAKANYQNFSGFVEPIAKDKASQINIQTINNSNINFVFSLDSIDANAAQNAAQREIGLLSEPITGIYRNVVFYWYQARNDAASQAGDKT